MTQLKFQVGDVIKCKPGNGTRSEQVGVVVRAVAGTAFPYAVRWVGNVTDYRRYATGWLEMQCDIMSRDEEEELRTEVDENRGRYIVVFPDGTAKLVQDVQSESEAREYTARLARAKDKPVRLCKVVGTCEPKVTVTTTLEWDNE